MDDLTSAIQKVLSRETFFFVGNLLSIISFVLTIFVLLNVRKLRNVYKLKSPGAFTHKGPLQISLPHLKLIE